MRYISSRSLFYRAVVIQGKRTAVISYLPKRGRPRQLITIKSYLLPVETLYEAMEPKSDRLGSCDFSGSVECNLLVSTENLQ